MPFSKLSLSDKLFTRPCKNPDAKRSPAPVKSIIFKFFWISHSTTSFLLIAILPFSPLVRTINFPRFFVNEIVREKILLNYKKEIPYSVEVLTEEFKEDETIIRIRSVIMVERDSQKGIIIGHKGEALKKIGIQARKDLESFFGKQIHIALFVKVNKNWRNNQNQLKRFGYK